MPLNLSVGLPGPFTYTRRLTGNRKPGQHGAMWWFFVGWWWMPIVWLLAGAVWFTVLVCKLTLVMCRAAILYWARRQDTRRP